MDKYIGTYRVEQERDNDGNPMEFSYVRGTCNHKGSKIYRYSDDKLRLYVPAGAFFKTRLEAINVQYTVVLRCSEEWVFEFDEELFPIFAGLIKAKTKGCAIKPKSKRNKNKLSD